MTDGVRRGLRLAIVKLNAHETMMVDEIGAIDETKTWIYQQLAIDDARRKPRGKYRR